MQGAPGEPGPAVSDGHRDGGGGRVTSGDVAMSALSALRAALRVYAVGIAVELAQLMRRLRGGFRAPGECV